MTTIETSNQILRVFAKAPKTALAYAVTDNDIDLLQQCLNVADDKMVYEYFGRNLHSIVSSSIAIVDAFLAKISATHKTAAASILPVACKSNNIDLANHLWATYPSCKNVNINRMIEHMSSFQWAIAHDLIAPNSLTSRDFNYLVNTYHKTNPDFLHQIVLYFDVTKCIRYITMHSESWLWYYNNIDVVPELGTMNDLFVTVNNYNYDANSTTMKYIAMMIPKLVADEQLVKLYLQSSNTIRAYVKIMLRQIGVAGLTFCTSATDVDYVISSIRYPDIPHSYINDRYIYCGNKLVDILPEIIT